MSEPGGFDPRATGGRPDSAAPPYAGPPPSGPPAQTGPPMPAYGTGPQVPMPPADQVAAAPYANGPQAPYAGVPAAPYGGAPQPPYAGPPEAPYPGYPHAGQPPVPFAPQQAPGWGHPSAPPAPGPAWGPAPLPPANRSRMPLVLGLVGGFLVLLLLGVGGSLVVMHQRGGSTNRPASAQLQTPEGVQLTVYWPKGLGTDTDRSDVPDGADLTATDDFTHFIDVYTGDSIASSVGDIGKVATQIRGEHSADGASLGPVKKVRNSMQWTESWPKSSKGDASTDVVGVTVIDSDWIAVDYNGDPDDVSTDDGFQAVGYVLDHLHRN